MKEKILAFLNSHWTVTLVATTVGVYLGIFMNEHYSRKAECDRATHAIADVLLEMHENYLYLVEWDSISKRNYDFFTLIKPDMVAMDELTLLMTPYKRDSITAQYPGFLIVKDSTKQTGDKYRYRGSLELEFNSQLVFTPHFEIAWSALKDTEYIRHLDFDCIKAIDFFYKMFDYSNDARKKWLSAFMNKQTRSEKMEGTLDDWEMENQVNQMLIKAYPEIQAILERCR